MASGYGWRSDAPGRSTRAARTFGHLTSALLNLGLLWVAHQLLDWGWPPFLTEDFTLVLGVLTVSFVLSAVTDVVLALFDDRGVRALVDLARAVVGLWVAVRVWRVFPFEWADHAAQWSLLARVVIVAVALGSSFGIVDGVIKVARAALDTPPSDGPPGGDDRLEAGHPTVGASGPPR